MKKLFFVIAIGVSLLVSRSVIAHNTNNATLVTYKAPPPRVRFVKVRLLMTAYVPRRGKKTATGANANHPGFAADFHIFRPGTKISIPAQGIFNVSVDDTGGAMRQDAKKGIIHIDLRIPRSSTAHHRAMKIGKQWIDAYVALPSVARKPNS